MRQLQPAIGFQHPPAMQKKEIVWISVLIILGAIYVVFFSHWFDKRQIGITVSVRPSRRPGETVYPVFFTLNSAYKLTSVEVLPMDNNKVDPGALPAWHLISDSNSVPTRAFRYGQPIHGMKPALNGIHADHLVPGTAYRLLLTTRDASCQIDFQAKAIGQ
jgi:hypothetical protein